MNYIDFYKLKEQPFSTSVDSRFYYSSDQHSEALLRLHYAVEQRKGLAVLVGGVGTGKTTLARRLLEELSEEDYESALLVVIHTAITSEWLLRKVAVQLGVTQPEKEKSHILTQLYKRLLEIYDAGKKAVVLIDEAQMLHRKEVMEEFRGMLNIEMDGKKLISFVFFGLTSLDDTLALDKPLLQRVAVRYQLKSFIDHTTEDYIRYRLKVAGAKKPLFTEDALPAIHLFSKGIPRLINTICDNALFEAFLRKKQLIDKTTIDEVAIDLNLSQTS